MHRFWRAVITLTQFAAIDREAIRALADDPHLRQRPEAVESIAQALIDAVYEPGTRNYQRDAHRQARAELNRLKGSRFVRLALRLKRVLGR